MLGAFILKYFILFYFNRSYTKWSFAYLPTRYLVQKNERTE